MTERVKISLIDATGRREEVLAGERTVTMYARYGGREIVVMPDECRFHLQFGKRDSIRGLVCIEVTDDGEVVIRSNDCSKRFSASYRIDERMVLVAPVDTKGGKRQDAKMAPQG